MSEPRTSRVAARARRRRRERGVALIMVLGAIAVMVVMLAEFQDDAGAEFAAATAARDSVQAEYFARSSVNLSRLLIAAEPTMRQAIAPLFMFMKRTPPQLPVWEYADRILGAFNDSEASKDFAGFAGLDMSLGKNLGLKGGHFEIQIVDEDSKINVNMGAYSSNLMGQLTLAKELMALMAPLQYDPIFQQRDSTGNYNDRLTTCSAIIDWGDTDQQMFSCDLTSNTPSSNAPEDAWYQLLPKPYRRKNAPYDSLEELHMARGVSDDFWSLFVDPDPTNPKKRLITVWGQGPINVNSANPLTLIAITCAGAPQADLCTDTTGTQMQLLVMGLTMAQGITMGAPLFGSPQDFVNTMKGQGLLGPMLAALGIKPVAKFQAEPETLKAVSIESKVFSIYAVGVVKGYKRETRVKIHTVVDFRTAPSLAGPGGLLGLPGAPGAPGTTPPAAGVAGGQQVATTGATTDPNAIAAALQPSVGGQVLYYDIE
jgi:general secretion pathway protein K